MKHPIGARQTYPVASGKKVALPSLFSEALYFNCYLQNVEEAVETRKTISGSSPNRPILQYYC
jgi:hypothetical protein